MVSPTPTAGPPPANGSEIDLVSYLQRYRTARSASALGAIMPLISNWSPSRIRCAGERRLATASLQVGRTSPVSGSAYSDPVHTGIRSTYTGGRCDGAILSLAGGSASIPRSRRRGLLNRCWVLFACSGVRPRRTSGNSPQPGYPRRQREVHLSAGASLSIARPAERSLGDPWTGPGRRR